MSIVKLSNGHSSKAMLNYLDGGTRKADLEMGDSLRKLVFSSFGYENTHDIEEGFRLTRELHCKTDGVQYHHATLSLDPESSTTSSMGDEKLTSLAKDFADSFVQGHDYAIFIHRDTSHPHAHVIWNSINYESGKKFHSSKTKLHEAVKIKNSLDQKYELEHTPGFGEKGINPDMTRDRELRKFERDPFEYSWKEDLKSKIQAAKDQSHSFEDCLKRLSNMDIETAIRGKKDPKITYSFVDADGKNRRARETSLGENYSRRKIKNEIESRSPELQTLREVDRKPDRDIAGGLEKLRQRPCNSIPSVGERNRTQEVTHRQSRIDLNGTFEESRVSGPELREVARNILEDSYRRDQMESRPTHQDSRGAKSNSKRSKPFIEKDRNKPAKAKQGTFRNGRTCLPDEIHRLSAAMGRINPSLDPWNNPRLVNPESVLKLKSFRSNHARHLRKQGGSLFQRREQVKPYGISRADRANTPSYERVLRSVISHGVSTCAGLERIREFTLEKISSFGKSLSDKLGKLRGRFTKSRELSHQYGPKVELNYQHAREHRLEYEQSLEISHKREIRHSREVDRGMSMGR